jgi:hypothetical protein
LFKTGVYTRGVVQVLKSTSVLAWCEWVWAKTSSQCDQPKCLKIGVGGRRLLLSGCQRQLCLCWQACFKTGVKQRWPFTRTFYTRLVTSRMLVKWCRVSKPVLVKPALNPIYTSINTGVNNTGLNKTGVSGPCKRTH